MSLTETLLFYLLVGAGVSAAVWLSEAGATGHSERVFRALSAIAFWPFYLPILLLDRGASGRGTLAAVPRGAAVEPADEMGAAIMQVEGEMDAALSNLGGWAEGTLAGERDRLAELRSAWRLQAARIRELDQLLKQTEPIASRERVPSDSGEGSPTDDAPQGRIQHSEQARRENIERLRALRRQMHDDLMGTLAWVRELVTMIHLAKYTGAPASRAQELVAQIAAAVEGLSEVTTWAEECQSVKV
jgi:hypothetical protein